MTRRAVAASGTLLALLVGAAACSPTAQDDSAAVLVAQDEAPGADGARTTVAGEDVAAESRQVITTASVTVVVRDAREAADEAAAIAAEVGGRVDSRSERANEDEVPPSAYLTLRVPADRVEGVLDDLKELGDVRNLSLDRRDVTLTVTDLDARIQALEVSVARLQDLMSSATSTADLLQAENALTQRQANLDSLQAQRTYLAEQVALATISVALLPEEVAPTPAPGSFVGGLATGWNALVTAFNRVVEVAGILVPWTVLAGLLVAAGYLARRRSRARRRRASARDETYENADEPGGPDA